MVEVILDHFFMRLINLYCANVFLLFSGLFGALVSSEAYSATVAYIHGDVAPDGTVPSGVQMPYDQMLLDDSGNTGLSMFKVLVETQGHTIDQFYDQQTELNSGFLNNKDVLIFGLHQKIWSTAEKAALDVWLNNGGGMFIYSDSASGGFFRIVGAQNPVGQTVTNNLIASYGMQITVDQADGTTDQLASPTASITEIRGRRLEGEGVSPVAISPSNSQAEILIPYTRSVNRQQNIAIANPVFAALAIRSVGDGHIAVMFDRQPMWNAGPGSDISKQDNEFILQAMINFLAQRPISPPPMPPVPPTSGQAILAPLLPILLDDD